MNSNPFDIGIVLQLAHLERLVRYVGHNLHKKNTFLQEFISIFKNHRTHLAKLLNHIDHSMFSNTFFVK